MLFQGEEWGASTPFQYFTAHDADLGALVSEGRRKEFAAFGWDPDSIPDPQAIETFCRSRLRWEELAAPAHAGLLDWYRGLIALRRDYPALRDGDYQSATVSVDELRRQLVVRRGSIVVACNLAERPGTINTGGAARVLLASNGASPLQDGRLELPAESIAVCE